MITHISAILADTALALVHENPHEAFIEWICRNLLSPPHSQRLRLGTELAFHYRRSCKARLLQAAGKEFERRRPASTGGHAGNRLQGRHWTALGPNQWCGPHQRPVQEREPPERAAGPAGLAAGRADLPRMGRLSALLDCRSPDLDQRHRLHHRDLPGMRGCPVDHLGRPGGRSGAQQQCSSQGDDGLDGGLEGTP